MTRTIPNRIIRRAVKVLSFNPSTISSNYYTCCNEKVIQRKIYSKISILLILAYLPTFVFAQNNRQVFDKPLMGSQFRIVIDSPDSLLAKNAADSAFNRISELNSIMSDYLDGSEINRLSASSGTDTWVSVSQELYDIVQQSVEISKATNGYFDITVGPVIQEWRRALRRNYFPDKKTIRRKRKSVGYRYILFDSSNRRIKLIRPDMKLDLGGIGKGYAADQAIILLKTLGFQSVMVDAGGDLTLNEPPTGKKGWEIDISSGNSQSDSIEYITISNAGIATSGATYRYLEHKGRKYSHIVNPRTGVGLLHHLRTTVIAPTGTQADALSTAVSIAGIRRSKKMIRHFPAVKVWLIETKNGNVRSWNSITP